MELLPIGARPNRLSSKLLDCLSCCFDDVPELAKDAKRLGIRKGCCG
jgi:hypothetical protein